MSRLCLLLFPLLSFFLVEDVSMEPLLTEGDRILVLKTKRVKPLNTLVVRSPQNVLSVKTCLLAEGDAIVFEGHFLIAHKKRFFLQPQQLAWLKTFTHVPRDSFFVVGENSYHSRDSRAWGFIGIDDIMGKVIFIKRHS